MLESAAYLRNSADMNADPLSDILRLTSAESLVTGGFSAGGQWAIRFPAPAKIKFFAVVRGHCWVCIDGEREPIRFDEGDVGLMTAPRSFVLASEPGLPPVDAMDLFSRSGQSVTQIGDGRDFTQIGGHVLLDAASGQLLANVLPPWIRIDAGKTQASTFRWLLARLVEERANAQPGTQLVSAHLAQLLFIQILRAHMETDAAASAGWFRVMSDRRLAPALGLMHGDPARAWHLDELADACAMSRTTFALRFRTAAGVAPLTYLAEWRMRLAERALRDGTSTVAVIAQSIGYASESAFSHAFKRVTGQSPRDYRHTAQPSDTNAHAPSQR
jgi:AraC-like DNA-binding protein